MLIKHVKDIDVEDEYIIVEKEESLYEVARKMEAAERGDVEHDEIMVHPILAAYVMEEGSPIGFIDRDLIIEETILKGKNAKQIKAKDVMKKPLCCNVNDTTRDVVNLIIDNGILSVAVCDGDQLVSVISVYDAVFLNETLNEF